jgi:hypothetical protein
VRLEAKLQMANEPQKLPTREEIRTTFLNEVRDEPGADVIAEFSSASLLLEEYGDAAPPFAIARGYLKK